MITITGGKLTTWRRMAKLAVDRVVERDGREAPCRTHEIPLGAPTDPDALPRVRWGRAGGLSPRWPPATATPPAACSRPVREHPELAVPIVPGQPDLLAEALFSARHEQARTVADVLLRRTRLGLLDARAVCGAERRDSRRGRTGELAVEHGLGRGARGRPRPGALPTRRRPRGSRCDERAGAGSARGRRPAGVRRSAAAHGRGQRHARLVLGRRVGHDAGRARGLGRGSSSRPARA